MAARQLAQMRRGHNMPYANVSEVPDYVPKKKRKQWLEIWNKVYKEKIDAGESKEAAEKSAYAQATGVANKESKGAVMDREVRFVSGELRATLGAAKDEVGIAPLMLEGYAATFNSLSHDLNGFREKIMPGAFSRTLKENADVRALKNHDPNFVLGRSKSGTLKLEQDSRGLRFQVELPNTQYAKDLHESIKRGDMDQCSFAFKAVGQKWSEEQDGNGDWYAMRELHDVDLFDVSAVTYPAYEDTSIAARGDIVPAEIRSSIAAKKTGAAPEVRDEDCAYEDLISEVCSALAEKFPSTYGDGAATPYNNGKYYVIETHDNYVIVCDWQAQEYYKISYVEDAAAESYTFGTPQPVEKAWVPAERAVKRFAELRKSYMDMLADKHMASALETYAAAAALKKNADDHAAAATALQAKADAARLADFTDDPDDGDSENEGPWQNRIVDEQDVWDETQQDDTDGANDNGDDDDRKVKRAAARKAAGVETRADGKVRTKRVGGKNLTKDKFAYVGDPERTETWKLPIHDAAHVRNALARFNQTQGIPSGKRAGVYRKIVAAAKKFGIEVSAEENSRALATCDADESEVLLLRATLQRASW